MTQSIYTTNENVISLSTSLETPPQTICIIAGEVSGDQLGYHLIERLHQDYPLAKFVGIGGNKMSQAGCDCWYHISDLSYFGIVDVVKNIRKILHTIKQTKKLISQHQVDLFIGIDNPDFNLRIAKFCKQELNIPTIQYVSPSVWAWRQGRIHNIKASTDLVLCLLPFEVNFYQQHQHKAVYVGHTLAKNLSSFYDIDSSYFTELTDNTNGLLEPRLLSNNTTHSSCVVQSNHTIDNTQTNQTTDNNKTAQDTKTTQTAKAIPNSNLDKTYSVSHSQSSADYSIEYSQLSTHHSSNLNLVDLLAQLPSFSAAQHELITLPSYNCDQSNDTEDKSHTSLQNSNIYKQRSNILEQKNNISEQRNNLAVSHFDAEYQIGDDNALVSDDNTQVGDNREINNPNNTYQQIAKTTNYNIALLPGSRRSEINLILPSFLDGLLLAQKQKIIPSNAHINLPVAKESLYQPICDIIKDYPQLHINLIKGNAHTVLQSAVFGLVASGTATLDALLCHTPIVVGYRLTPLNYFIAKRLVKTKYVALANILMEQEFYRELLQDDLSAVNIVDSIKQLLNPQINFTKRYESWLQHGSLIVDSNQLISNSIFKLLQEKETTIKR